jgi:hypothetical protein
MHPTRFFFLSHLIFSKDIRLDKRSTQVPGQSLFLFFLKPRPVHALVVRVLGQFVKSIQDYNYDFFYILFLQSHPLKFDLY